LQVDRVSFFKIYAEEATMTKSIKILIVEDKPAEVEKALDAIKALGYAEQPGRMKLGSDGSFQTFLNSVEKGRPHISVRLATTGSTASSILRHNTLVALNGRGDAIGWVITDLMFPYYEGGEEGPNGLAIAADCINSGVPVVVCSDTHHHDAPWMTPLFQVLAQAHLSGKIPVFERKEWKEAVAFFELITL